jgi:hypothetical protein
MGSEDLMTSLSKLLSVTTTMFWLAMVGSSTTVTRAAGGRIVTRVSTALELRAANSGSLFAG